MAVVESRIERVVLYAGGARVIRVVTLEAAVEQVRIIGLPLAVMDDTLRVDIVGPAIATQVRADLDLPVPAAAAAPERSPAVRAAERRVLVAQSGLARLEAALATLARSPVVAEPPSSDEPPAAWSQVLAARRTVIAVRGVREHALRAELTATQRALDTAKRGLAAEVDRDARASTAKAPRAHEVRKHADVTLVPTGSGPITIRIEYLVAAARWTPSYVARLTAEGATLEMRASIAQLTGEDWTGVQLALSTAMPAKFSPLPELAAQRIGRRQDEPKQAGFRAPPTGAEALYADYDRTRVPHSGARNVPELSREVWDDGSSRSKDRFMTPPGGHLMPPPPPLPPAMAPRGMPMPASPSAAMLGVSKGGGALRSRSAGGGGDESASLERPHAAALPEPTAQLDYHALRMALPSQPSRGTLVPLARDALEADSRAATAAHRVSSLPLPPGCRVEWEHAYDYAYAADGVVEIVADGAWHSIAITSAPTTATLRHVATPREQADVFRLAKLANPFAGPLLPGPIDIYDRGRFLLTSQVEMTVPGATVELGLGVDPGVKIARNTEFREEAAGMLRGALKLHHSIVIDVQNLAGKPIELEVRERVPVARDGDDEIEVSVGRVEPSWERYTPDPDAPRSEWLRGGYRWKLAVPAGAKRSLRVAYDVKIASKLELVGGNRRDA